MKILSIYLLAVLSVLFVSYADAGTGNSLAFSNTVMTVSNNFLNTTNGFTIAFWFCRRLGDYTPVLMGPSAAWYIQFYPDGNSVNVHSLGDRIATYSYTNGGWYHCAVVQDSGSLQVFRNGAQVYSNTYGGAPSSGTFLVGRYTKGGYYFNGMLDDLAWWSRKLTSGEVYTVSGGGVPSYANTNSVPWNSGLVGLWRFDESSGTNALDATPNGNNGNITAGSWTNGFVPLPPAASSMDKRALFVLDALLSEANR